MLKAYTINNGNLREVEDDDTQEIRKAQWIDVFNANEQEKQHLEETLNIELSPVNDYEPFQVSSHYSATERQITMTGLVLTFRVEDEPHLAKITFIRSGEVLVTVSDSPNGLSLLVKECENCFNHKSGLDDILAAILDMLVDHSDNILDKIGHDLDHVTLVELLQSSPRRRNRQLENILTQLGPNRETLVKLRRSVLSFRRMIAFMREQNMPKSLVIKLETFERDLQSIAEAESDLSATAGFLLDGVVGFIGLLQNKVMNVLTLVATVLTPPMVIIYGMNFKIMPELQWAYGYPFAIGLCLVSSVTVFFYMRWRGM